MQTSEFAMRGAATDPPNTPRERISRPIGTAILIVSGILIVEVLLEGWLVTKFGVRGVDAEGIATVAQAEWPKTLKSLLYGLLLVLTVAKLTVDRSWRMLTTKADLALVVLGVIMVLAGLFGGSPAVLIGQALFVYFRGVIVFYAFRALRPSWAQVKPLLWIAGGIMFLNCVLALGQFLLGYKAYTGLGWVNLQWADEGRTQGLLEHPNDLGHLTAFMLLGLAAWFVNAEKIKKRWWFLFGFVALILAVAQSRQSTVALVGALAVVVVLRRQHFKRMIGAGLIVVLMSAVPVVLSEEARYQLNYRLGGLFNAFGMSGGVNSKKECTSGAAMCDGEIRVLFAKQGAKLWAEEPVLGYGVGQFGGIVALKHDPEWNKDPRFQEVLGPDGFYLHGFQSTSVDVFWLHLLVEVGALGVLAYLVWLWFLGAPLAAGVLRRPGQVRGDPIRNTMLTWGAAAIVFGGLIAAWSPSLEDPIFPPLLFAVIGFAWVLHNRQADDDTVRAERRD